MRPPLPLIRRWLKFHAVGAMGIIVQLAVLSALAGALRLHYLAATALAVEAAILHNFLWHERWTWNDRREPGLALWRLLRFNFSTGAVSIVANLLLMRLFAGWLGLHYLPANLLSIATCSLANFLLSELFVFRRRSLNNRGTDLEAPPRPSLSATPPTFP